MIKDWTEAARASEAKWLFATAMRSALPGREAEALFRHAELQALANLAPGNVSLEAVYAEMKAIENELSQGGTVAARAASAFLELEILLDQDTEAPEPSATLSALVNRTLENLPALGAAPERARRMKTAA